MLERKWTVIAKGSADDWGESEPYTAGEAIERFFLSHPEATEEDVERIAEIYHCYVKWK